MTTNEGTVKIDISHLASLFTVSVSDYIKMLLFKPGW
jgi:hypothetical protein